MICTLNYFVVSLILGGTSYYLLNRSEHNKSVYVYWANMFIGGVFLGMSTSCILLGVVRCLNETLPLRLFFKP